MRLIVIRDKNGSGGPQGLPFAPSLAPLSTVISVGAGQFWCGEGNSAATSPSAGCAGVDDLTWAVPGSWLANWPRAAGRAVECTQAGAVAGNVFHAGRDCQWLVISNGGFISRLSRDALERTLNATEAGVVAITADPNQLAYGEHVRLTDQGELVGYRRFFRDSAAPSPLPMDWPHHLFVKTAHVDCVLGEGLPEDFDVLVDRARSSQIGIEAMAVAGWAVDIESAEGLLPASRIVLKDTLLAGKFEETNYGRRTLRLGRGEQISPEARFIGPVLLGDQVRVEAGAVVIGPSILCDGCAVGQDAVVNASILGAGVALEAQKTIENSIALLSQDGRSAEPTILVGKEGTRSDLPCSTRQGAFRAWPRFSYAGYWKRLVDVVAASVILILFAPLMPFIALAIKINSPGPLFFKDRRQGLHGKPFNCVKFRTMRVGAADIQDKLRFVCEVDGPQFKMADDPRISTVGHFLRETYLDEIPQFFNVLMGQMSLVGPRPSPEKENTLCPWWRDARLSVRPGISGLWQVFRTREPYRDFQEWIFYDTRYVEELSLRMDLWVCWCTFKKMVDNVIRQF